MSSSGTRATAGAEPTSEMEAGLPLIEAEGLEVRYPVPSRRPASLKALLVRPFYRASPQPEHIHAVRGVTLSVWPGERIGIIGGNGSGKSTLLRVLGGIYPFAAGSLTVRGEARGLFDLGTGFILDDTGRNNIYHRGLLLGQTRQTLKRLEPDIIAFAGLEKAIDLPLKAYSAGMLIRLAFTVSTLIEGDILLIDEIFGAGDEAFMKRARDRLRATAAAAQCVLFVSHDLAAIEDMCTRSIWLRDGLIAADGAPREVNAAYLAEVLRQA